MSSGLAPSPGTLILPLSCSARSALRCASIRWSMSLKPLAAIQSRFDLSPFAPASAENSARKSAAAGSPLAGAVVPSFSPAGALAGSAVSNPLANSAADPPPSLAAPFGGAAAGVSVGVSVAGAAPFSAIIELHQLLNRPLVQIEVIDDPAEHFAASLAPRHHQRLAIEDRRAVGVAEAA